MRVTVFLSPDVAEQLLRGAVETDATNELLSVVRVLGIELRPMHPGTTDPALRSTFFAEAGDRAHAHQIISRLQALPATEIVYIPPEDDRQAPANAPSRERM